MLFYQHLSTGYDGTLSVSSGPLVVVVDGCDVTFVSGSVAPNSVHVNI